MLAQEFQHWLRLTQEDLEFKASPHDVVRPCLNFFFLTNNKSLNNWFTKSIKLSRTWESLASSLYRQSTQQELALTHGSSGEVEGEQHGGEETQ
jgi:hypothetical protein